MEQWYSLKQDSTYSFSLYLILLLVVYFHQSSKTLLPRLPLCGETTATSNTLVISLDLLATPPTNAPSQSGNSKVNIQNYYLQQVRDVLPLDNKSKTWNLSDHSKRRCKKEFGGATSLVDS